MEIEVCVKEATQLFVRAQKVRAVADQGPGAAAHFLDALHTRLRDGFGARHDDILHLPIDDGANDVTVQVAASQPRKMPAHFLEARRPHFQLLSLYTSDAADERSSVDLGGRR